MSAPEPGEVQPLRKEEKRKLKLKRNSSTGDKRYVLSRVLFQTVRDVPPSGPCLEYWTLWVAFVSFSHLVPGRK